MSDQNPLSLPLWELYYADLLARRHARSVELCHADPVLAADVQRLASLATRIVSDMVRYYGLSEKERQAARRKAEQYDRLQRGVGEPTPDPDAGVFA